MKGLLKSFSSRFGSTTALDAKEVKVVEPTEGFYDFKAWDLEETEEIPMSRYKGKVVVIVNVASRCGLTDRSYKEMVMLDKKYRDQGLAILAFPCNQFNYQEPGTKEEIRQFVKDKYGVEFQMFKKINVNGKDAHPIFKWLKKQESSKSIFGMNFVKWNFAKFVLDKDGQVRNRLFPATLLKSKEAALKAYLEGDNTFQQDDTVEDEPEGGVACGVKKEDACAMPDKKANM